MTFSNDNDDDDVTLLTGDYCLETLQRLVQEYEADTKNSDAIGSNNISSSTAEDTNATITPLPLSQTNVEYTQTQQVYLQVLQWTHCHVHVLQAMAIRLTLDVICHQHMRILSLASSRSSTGGTGTDNNAENESDSVDSKAIGVIGIMISASHLPERYNGFVVSLLLHNRQHQTASMVNHTKYTPQCPQESVTQIATFYRQQHVNHHDPHLVVHIGRDTRESSIRLANLVVQTARAAGVSVIDCNEVPTPYLTHRILNHYQLQKQKFHLNNNNDSSTGTPGTQKTIMEDMSIEYPPSSAAYYNELANAYACLVQQQNYCHHNNNTSTKPSTNYNSLLIDCAGGIAYMGVRECVMAIQAQGKVHRRIVATNRIGTTTTPLNHNCGAVHVRKMGHTTWYNQPPIGKSHCAALTGDANRVIFFFTETNEQQGKQQQEEVIVISPDVMLGWMIRRVTDLLNQPSLSSSSSCASSPDVQVGVLLWYPNATDVFDSSLLCKYLGPNIPVESNETASRGWDVTVRYNTVTNEISTCWNKKAIQTCTRTAAFLPVLLPCYPDGLAHLLLVDGLLLARQETLANILHDYTTKRDLKQAMREQQMQLEELEKLMESL